MKPAAQPGCWQPPTAWRAGCETVTRKRRNIPRSCASCCLPGCASQRIRELLRDAGIAGERQQYCAHCLRTTFASKCARAGVPLAVIQSWLGHTSQEVTRIYARIGDMAAKSEALLRLPGL